MWHRISDHHVEKKSEADTIFLELKAYQVFDWCELTDEDWRSPDVNKAAERLAEEIDRLLMRGSRAPEAELTDTSSVTGRVCRNVTGTHGGAKNSKPYRHRATPRLYPTEPFRLVSRNDC